MKICYLILIFVVSVINCNQKNFISFNRLFQESDYSKVIDLCMQIWADLDGVSTEFFLEKLTNEQYYDIQIARFTRIKFYCMRMQQQVACLYYEDLNELLQILTLIQNRISLVEMDQDDLFLINQLVLFSKKQIVEIMDQSLLVQSEHPISCSS